MTLSKAASPRVCRSVTRGEITTVIERDTDCDEVSFYIAGGGVRGRAARSLL